jgi:cobalt-zinc-cadmium efflux system membrane fusion protein
MKSKPILLLTSAILLISVIWFYRSFFSGAGNTKKISTEIINPNLLQLDTERIKNLRIETLIVSSSNFSPKVELLGETEAVPNAIIDVPARVSGRLTAIHFIEGDKVKKGQILATIDSPELTRLRSNYMTAKTKHFAAEQNYQRIKSLVQMNLAAKQELVDAESNLQVIRSEKVSAEENLRVNGLSISDSVSGIYHVVAPKSGLAIMRNAILGSQILGNQTLTTIADLTDLWFQGKIFEGDLHFLKEGDGASIILNAYPELEFKGKLDHIGEKVDPVSRTIHARILFKNIERKGKIGLFGKAYIEIAPRFGVKIPSSSIQVLGGKNFVFVKKSENQFLWKGIEIGSVIGTDTEVKAGLIDGEQIVTNGGFELKAILFKSTFGEE